MPEEQFTDVAVAQDDENSLLLEPSQVDQANVIAPASVDTAPQAVENPFMQQETA